MIFPSMMTDKTNHYLIDHSIAPSTNSKYSSAFNQFLSYLHKHRLNIDSLSTRQLDSHLVDYIHHLHVLHVPFTTAQYCLSSLIRYTGSRDSFHRSRLALRGWRRLDARKKRHRPPLTLEVTVLLSVVLLKSNYYAAGVATLLGFHCYLRINEICNLKIRDVVFNGDSRVGTAMSVLATIRLARTKTGENQAVNVTDPHVAAVLYDYICSITNINSIATCRRSLFGFSAARYRSLFGSAVDALGLGDVGYTPHSLRHGGCTRDFMLNVPLLHIQYRGRWRSEASLRTYVNTGTVLLLRTRLSSELTESAQLFMRHLVTVMRTLAPSQSSSSTRTHR